MTEKKNIHAMHRSRVKERFFNEGLENLEPHVVLELLLYYAIPQGDTNPLAHALINEFGSLRNVFEASYDELIAVDGVGAHSACLLKILPQFAKRYVTEVQDEVYLENTDKAVEYLYPRFIGEQIELVYGVFVDSKMKVKRCVCLHKGSFNSAQVSLRKIAEMALLCNAHGLILAHNHPGGVALPSEEDVATTKMLKDTLANLSIKLCDHIIIADRDSVSFLDTYPNWNS